jgi:hypothetical protein
MTETTYPDQHPADILLTVVVTLLAPMFITASGGNLELARNAALETINAHRVRNHVTLLAIAKVIGFGLATLGSLSLSMMDDLPVPLILRLRGNANALDRSADRNERKLEMSYPNGGEPSGPGFDEAEVRASVAEAQRRAAEAQARSQAPQPRLAERAAPNPPAPRQQATEPSGGRTSPEARTIAGVAEAPGRSPDAHRPAQPAMPTTVAARPQEQPYASVWAAAMAEVAAEELAAAAHLPPAQRQEATARAAILSETANALLSGATVERPKPGDLEALMRAVGR